MNHQANEPERDDESVDSVNEALCEMLGLKSLTEVAASVDNPEAVADDEPARQRRTLEHFMGLSRDSLRELIKQSDSVDLYHSESVCHIPDPLCLDPALLRRITDELTWASDKFRNDKSFETIRVLSKGLIEERRNVTRFENFVRTHAEWQGVCDYVGRLVSIVCGQPMALFKEKLNLKPPGGSGFAPHLDSPSLRIALGDSGPRNFVTVMVAIDAMNELNGCLQLVRGKWSEENAVETIPPDSDGNPDAGGRAGAIPPGTADNLPFEPFICDGGSITVFNGWVPHRSASNRSPFPRRAVFLTYNPVEEGEYRDQYYEHMNRLRSSFRANAGLDEQAELDALATIPKI
jgi:ectoine hydroxylase-related dioxygenase (phytanoyl-CoA dioxygenase family)